MRKSAVAICLSLSLSTAAAAAQIQSRYFLHGDGKLSLASGKGPAAFHGRYRNPDGTYSEDAMRRINAIFSARWGDPVLGVSPRLIEFIDYLQDRFDPNALVTITSGFRSPEHNTRLRDRVALAARASLHQYGMAADLWIKGVPSKCIWEAIRDDGLGGAGYYHGRNVHVDVGPARFWDETSSGVDTDASLNNRLIGLVADRDIYLPGEQIELRFIRMTAFPIGLRPEMRLEAQDKKGRWKKAEEFSPAIAAEGKPCVSMASVRDMAGIGWPLPERLGPGRYRAVASFCDNDYEGMPSEVASPEFEVRAR
ncbi:MAG: YcbK family protein [Proteobacteria bacterium]|nr:YcbK family protein [Pseudomonadota bacterium]